jgi:hypothetical protein
LTLSSLPEKAQASTNGPERLQHIINPKVAGSISARPI